MTALVVVAVGPQAIVVDGGRPGWAHIGVTGGGALDPGALALANRLVGNPETAAGLEVLLGGLTLRAEAATTVAVTGPPGGLAVGRRRPGTHAVVHVPSGETVHLPAPASGLRHYLAVAGGVDVEEVLGSRSTDTLSGLGPAPLAVGTRLPVGPASPLPCTGPVPVSVVPDEITVPVRLGPRDDWIADADAALRRTRWRVGADGDRVGVRLDGTPLERAPARRDAELPSEGLVPGAIQVPPDGRPVVFLTDHPTTGGYPVVGVVDRAALGAFAQARPGSGVRFVPLA